MGSNESELGRTVQTLQTRDELRKLRSAVAIPSYRETVRMAERSKALRSGRSPLLWAWVRIPLLTHLFLTQEATFLVEHNVNFLDNSVLIPKSDMT